MPKLPKNANADSAMPIIASCFMIASLKPVRMDCICEYDHGSLSPPFQSASYDCRWLLVQLLGELDGRRPHFSEPMRQHGCLFIIAARHTANSKVYKHDCHLGNRWKHPRGPFLGKTREVDPSICWGRPPNEAPASNRSGIPGRTRSQ